MALARNLFRLNSAYTSDQRVFKLWPPKLLVVQTNVFAFRNCESHKSHRKHINILWISRHWRRLWTLRECRYLHGRSVGAHAKNVLNAVLQWPKWTRRESREMAIFHDHSPSIVVAFYITWIPFGLASIDKRHLIVAGVMWAKQGYVVIVSCKVL